jgi:hypothetical protein
MQHWLIIGSLLAALACQPARAEALKFFGDMRGGRYASEREARDGTETDEDDFRVRLRLGAEAALGERWRLRGRLAGRYSTDQDRSRFWLKAWAPTRTGLELGDTTIDELYLAYAPPGADWSLRIGRFQGKFELNGIAAKSLDRNDSPNVDVTWTDGLHWQYRVAPAWTSHLILQHNVSSGTGTTARAPLSFSDDSSRVTVFTGLESNVAWGPVKQRMVALTWMPDTLAPAGTSDPRREHYLALTGRASAEWPLGNEGLRLRFGAELGWAPNTPERTAINSGTSGDADGRAAQFSMDALEFFKGHGIGFVYGRAGGGWLLSPDFRNNDRLLEVRYQWRFAEKWSMEARVRRREELEVPVGTLQARIDDDVYVRLTGKF